MPFDSTIGANSKGFVKSPDGSRLVVVEYVDKTVGFYHCKDLETRKFYTCHYSNFMPLQQIPSKYRQAAFERVAAIWGRALAQHPEPLKVDCSPLAPLSYMRLLREAREAKIKYGWQHPAIDETKWEEHAEHYTITEAVGAVIIGRKDAKFPAKADLVGKVIDPHEVVFKWSTMAELEAFCLLLDHKLITPRPAFVLYDLTPAIQESLEARYEVGFVQHENEPNKWSII